jgi:hypothetical protein
MTDRSHPRSPIPDPARAAAAAEVPPLPSVEVVPLDVPDVLATWRGVAVQHGGFGSDLALREGEPGVFYLLGDRGPNFETMRKDEKGFAVPSFAPQIGRFRRDGPLLRREAIIELKTAAGATITGLPHPPGPDSTGETAVNLEGEPLMFDPDGLDPEGLVVLDDGTFWVSDEYGPYLQHHDSTGRLIERIGPGAHPRALPAVFTRRRPNRGMEGLALLPDGRTLVGIMQSSLDNPDAGVRSTSRVTRLVLMDTGSGRTREILYLQEAPGMSNSAVCALTDTELVVIEHDALFPDDEHEPARLKRIFRIDLRGATDVNDPENRPQGLLLPGGRTLEQCTEAELREHGIRPAAKRMLVDLLALGYPHDKPEGLALLGDRTLAVINDDDFGIVGDGAGGIRAKILPRTGAVDRNALWVLTFAQRLAGSGSG